MVNQCEHGINTVIHECTECEIEALQSQLEAERAEKRELRIALEENQDELPKAIDSLIESNRVQIAATLNNQYPKNSEALSNTTAPTEANIRAQRDREIADWLVEKAPSRSCEDIVKLANELRQQSEEACSLGCLRDGDCRYPWSNQCKVKHSSK